jgi:hypothetical protein
MTVLIAFRLKRIRPIGFVSCSIKCYTRIGWYDASWLDEPNKLACETNKLCLRS